MITRPYWYLSCLTGWTVAIRDLFHANPNFARCIGGGRLWVPSKLSCLDILALVAWGFLIGWMIGIGAWVITEGIYRGMMLLLTVRGKFPNNVPLSGRSR